MKANQNNGSTKLAVLIWLVLVDSVHSLLLRYSRARDVQDMFFSSVAVFFTEIIKIVISLYMIFAEEKGCTGFVQAIKSQIISQPWDTLKVCIPAVLYTVQNNLFYIAASHLDAATFMIVSQLKIFTTAIFSVILLQRRLSRTQWFSLVLLFIGVSIVQLQTTGSSSSSKSSTHKDNPLIGFIAACIACAISGLAGVYFEKILKGSAPVSLWMRNVQMYTFTIPASFIAILVQDARAIKEHGFLFGFDSIVWLAVFWYAIGGISVAVCIKYADNIAKNFASSLAIVIATAFSVYAFGFVLTSKFVIGAALVISSVFLYSSSEVILHHFHKKSHPTNVV